MNKGHINTLVILGCGFDLDLGLKVSCADYSKSHFCPIIGNEYWSAFENTLRNEVIKWYKNGKDVKEAIKLNYLWQSYVKNISWFFTEVSDNYLEANIEKRRIKRTCAYKFLKRIGVIHNIKIYTFNYTNPYEYIDIPQTTELIHMHGRYYKDTFKKSIMTISQGHNIIFGIDECIPEDGIKNVYIHPLVKKNHPIYKEKDIITDLSKTEIVTFFGFSMGIIDYGYFANFFNTIKNNSTNCKIIYYVTYNEDSFKDFINNLKKNDINLEDITQYVPVKPIYTIKGPDNRDFCKMLNES